MARDGAKQLTQMEAFGLLDLVPVITGRQLVGLVDDHQIPVGEAKLFLQVVVAGKLVEARDHQVDIIKGVAAARLLDLFAREQGEGEAKLLEHLVLPLLDEAAWCDDQYAPGI